MAYDLARERTVLFGGRTFCLRGPGDPPAGSGQTFEWDGVEWHERRPAHRPAAGYGAAMAYDVLRRRVVLFGGQDGVASYDETWEWDGVDWVRREAPVRPGRGEWAMAYDVARARCVLCGTTLGRNETWEWDGNSWSLRTVAPAAPTPRPNGMAYDVIARVTVAVDSTNWTWAWTGAAWQRTAPATSPAVGSALTFDAVRGRVIAFGGDPGELLAWNWSTWTRIPAAQGPPPRSEHALVFDVARARAVLVGGTTVCRNHGDTWEWDGGTWSERAATPSVLAATIAFDGARGVATLFGTFVQTTGGTAGHETWEWNGARWVRRQRTVFPASFASPLVFDRVRQRSVMLAGVGGPYFDETWEWDGALWVRRLTTTRPSRRHSAALAYDAARGRGVLFGGVGVGEVELTDTLEYDGVDWTPRNLVRSPGPRRNAAMVYDEARRQVVLCGGSVGANFLNDTWLYDGTAWTQAQPRVRPTTGAMFAVFDPRRQRVLLTTGSATGVHAWEWDGTDWTWLPTEAAPSRWGATACYDSNRQQMVAYFGSNAGGETWYFGSGRPASTLSFGVPCNPTPTEIRIGSDTPLLGSHTSIEVAGAAPFGAVVLGLAMAPAAQRVGNCVLYLAQPNIPIPLLANAFGVASTRLTVPLVPALRGLTLVAQGFVADPRAGLLFTRGWQMTVGD